MTTVVSPTIYSRAVTVVGTFITYAKDSCDTALNNGAQASDLFLEPDPNNPYDGNAIKVMYRGPKTNLQLGFIPRPLAARIAEDKVVERLSLDRMTMGHTTFRAKEYMHICFDLMEDQLVEEDISL
jgi:hypothetical protein